MSRWASRPAPAEMEGVILFDGVCVFCSRWVRFVMARDPKMRFRFLPIQSERGRRLAEEWGVSPDNPETNIVVRDGRAWFKSDAALTVLAALPSTRGSGRLTAVPKSLRDLLYDLIARNRYRIFGRSETCMVPSEADRTRFLG